MVMENQKENCVFCKIVKGEIPVKKIYENKSFLSFPDANPRVKGHSLVISKEHVENFLKVNQNKGEEMVDAIKETASKIMQETNSRGFNIVNNNGKVASQIVEHLHFHIVPRKKGDSINVLG